MSLVLAGYYNRTAYAVPLGGSALHLLYRADVLAAHNASVPTTWHEVLRLAARLHSSPMPTNANTLNRNSTSSSTSTSTSSSFDSSDARAPEEEGQQQDAQGAAQSWAWGSGLCVDVRPGCCSQELLLGMWAPLAVSNSTSSGLLFHAPHMTPQLDTEAFKEALVTYGVAAVLGVSGPVGLSGSGRGDGSGGGDSSSSGGCAACGASGDVRGSVAAALAAAAGRAVHPAFVAGRCALTVASTEAVKALLARPSQRQGADSFSRDSSSGDVCTSVAVRPEWVGIAQLPGSAWVLNHTSRRLVPYDAILRTSGVSTVGTPTTRGPMTLEEVLGAVATAAPAAAPASATAPAWVNRAPVMGWGTTVGVVSARVEPWRQARALELLGQLAGSEGSWAMVSDEQVPLGPVRVEQLGAAATPQLDSRDDGGSAADMGAGVGVGGGDRGRGAAPGDWGAAGYDAVAVRQLLAAEAEAADHSHAVPPLTVPGAEQVM